MLKHSDTNARITIQMNLGYNNGDKLFMNPACSLEKESKIHVRCQRKDVSFQLTLFLMPMKGSLCVTVHHHDSSSPTAIRVTVWVQHHCRIGQLPLLRLSDIRSGLRSPLSVLLSWPVTWLKTTRFLLASYLSWSTLALCAVFASLLFWPYLGEYRTCLMGCKWTFLRRSCEMLNWQVSCEIFESIPR